MALDANAEHVTAIKRDGLRVIGKSPRVARFDITTDIEALGGKHSTPSCFSSNRKPQPPSYSNCGRRLTGRPVLVTLQNGMGNAEVLLDVPDAIVARGATMNAGRYVEPGVVENLIEGKTWLGPARGRVEDLARLGTALNEAGMPAEIVADPMGAVWSKFVFNCVMNPLGRADDGRQRRAP